MQINADFHIHSKYSMATSEKMDLPTIAHESQKKGIQLVATGDCLHPKWLSNIKELKEEKGLFKLNQTYFVLTVEIEDRNQVHHLLILPETSKAEELYERMKNHSRNLDIDGRPKVDLGGVEIAEIAREIGALVGPSHAFTPWTAMYAYHNSLKECYGERMDYIYFLELGLSADTSYADRISELSCLTYLSNSDAHSPSLNKLAREFNRFEVEDISFEELRKAIIREDGRKPILNVGMFPEEGKYNESACIRCFKHYTLKESILNSWTCTCGGRIKKGVKDRVNELATYEKPVYPLHRPPYLHLPPLVEVIAMALGHVGPSTKGVEAAWEKLVSTFSSEVAALVDADIRELGIVDERIVKAIKAFRKGEVVLHPGGGGKYGRLELPNNLDPPTKIQTPKNRQRTLIDFHV